MGKVAGYYRSAVVAAIVLVALSFIPIFMSERVLDAFVREDHIYETLTFVFLLAASILFAIAFLRSKVKLNLRDPFWIRKMVFLGLALLLFGAAGEEISWGQRVLGFKTPNLVESHNFQKEFTLHNLDFIQGPDAIVPLDFDQLAAIFFLTMGAFIPLICHFIPRIGSWAEQVFAVLPVQFSAVFIENYAIQKGIIRLLPRFPQFYHHPTLNIPVGVHETREFAYAFALMLGTIFYVFVKLRDTGEGPSTAGRWHQGS